MLSLFRFTQKFSLFNSLKTSLKEISIKLPSSPCRLAQCLKTTQKQIRKQMINPNKQIIDKQEAQIISLMNGCKIIQKQDSKNKKKRCPIITIMGHVDHGKTTLLDFLRNSKIAENQYGGITQKIGAFHVDYHDQKITVIDTPGHQAFNNMRVRGAKITDIIVLVISAVQGVKQQTLQVINLARQSNIPIIIAINKIDLPEAQPELIQKELISHNLNLQPYGGDIPVVHISGKTGKNVDLLIQLVLELAETSDLKANYQSLVEASVIQASNDSNDMGSVSILIQNGTIKPGTILVANDIYCKVKTIYDDKMNELNQAYPGEAVSIIGFKQLPASGDMLFEVQNQKIAKYIIQKKILQREKEEKDVVTGNSSKIKMQNRKQRKAFYRGFSGLWINKFKEVEDKLRGEIEAIKQQSEKNPKLMPLLVQKNQQLNEHLTYVNQYLFEVGTKSNTINIMIKSSDRGCEQTVLKELQKIKLNVRNQLKIQLNVLKSDVGQVTQNQIKQCHIFGGQIICFGVSVSQDAMKTYRQLKVPIKTHKLLHTFLEDIKLMCLNKTREDEIHLKEKGIGRISEVFKVSTGKKSSRLAAGVKVQQGRLCKKYKFKIIRNGKQISGLLSIQSLKNFKKEVIQLKKGDECTLYFTEDFEFQKGDTIRCLQ